MIAWPAPIANVMSSKKPILITGSHRSGTTWVGNMVALPSSVAYIHEPFHIHHRPGICSARFDLWFMYICSENESLYSSALEDTLAFRYSLSEELKVINSAKDVARLLRDYFRFTRNRILSKRPLIKDPIAVFSAEWLAKKFDMDVVVLIRHPAAFAGSLKKAQWGHPFSHFLRQPLLMQQRLEQFRPEIEEYSKSKKDVVDQAIVLWNLIHHMILRYRQDNPDWIFVKHETLSRNPVEEFGKIYKRLGLRFSAYAQEKIMAYSFAGSSKQKDSLKRDSQSNIFQWKARLTAEELKRIKERTQEIASSFYSEEDWTG